MTYLLKARVSPVNRTGSPQGFSPVQISHKLNIIQTMHINIKHTNIIRRATQKSLPFGKWRFRDIIGQENGPKTEKDKTVRARGLGIRTREEI